MVEADGELVLVRHQEKETAGMRKTADAVFRICRGRKREVPVSIVIHLDASVSMRAVSVFHQFVGVGSRCSITIAESEQRKTVNSAVLIIQGQL